MYTVRVSKDSEKLVVNAMPLHLPGVMGGLADRHSRPAARISERTSPSQPCFTPSIVSLGKMSNSGVDRKSQDDGGLLVPLPDDDRGGVAGAKE